MKLVLQDFECVSWHEDAVEIAVGQELCVAEYFLIDAGIVFEQADFIA